MTLLAATRPPTPRPRYAHILAATAFAAVGATQRPSADGVARKRPYGKLLISFVAAVTAVVPSLVDWDDTHIHNKTWSPHAKFHVGHTMAQGTVLGLLSLRYLWRRTGDPVDNLRVGALVAAAYWVAQAGAVLMPGTAMVDPQFADRIPTIAGIQTNQLHLDAILLALIAMGYRWQRAGLPNPPSMQ